MTMPHDPHPIDDPDYWKDRLAVAIRNNSKHQAIYMCTAELWNKIEAKHRKILQRVILPNESVLDLGCGWGRLISLMPKGWAGDYLGIDLSPNFINLAVKEHPDHKFICAPVEVAIPQVELDLDLHVGPDKKFDWCVFVSIRDMVILNNGREAWNEMERLARRVSNRLLILEYILEDDGLVE